MISKHPFRPDQKRLFLTLAAMIVALFVSVHPTAVLADIAPPSQPSGADLIPGEEITQVRMVSETVIVSVSDLYYEDHLFEDFSDQDNSFSGNYYDHSQGRAFVTATFHMMNLGDETEEMYVRFPLSSEDGYFFGYPVIVDLSVRVNGDYVDTTTKEIEPRGSLYPSLKWGHASLILNPVRAGYIQSIVSKDPGSHERDYYKWRRWEEFFVSFPPGEEVIVTITYTLEAEAWPTSPMVRFDYIMSTGAGWKDTIESADIILRFPYEASHLNVILDQNDQDWVIEGNDIRWHYDDLEPTTSNDFDFIVSKPYEWRTTVISEQQKVIDNPNDDEAWGRLAKAYKYFAAETNKGYLRDDTGGLEIYQLSIDAYQKATELDPDDALWHVGFADLLLKGAEWRYDLDSNELIYRAVNELYTAHSLDPDNQVVSEAINWAEEILSYRKEFDLDEGESIFLLLTRTPAPTVTSEPPIPTETIEPSPVPPTITASATPIPPTSTAGSLDPTPEPAFGIRTPLFFWGVVLLAAGGAAILYLSQKKE